MTMQPQFRSFYEPSLKTIGHANFATANSSPGKTIVIMQRDVKKLNEIEADIQHIIDKLRSHRFSKTEVSQKLHAVQEELDQVIKALRSRASQ